MFLTASLLNLLLALSITGSPVEVRNSPIILPLARRLNFSNSTIDLVQRDKARVVALRNYHTHGRRAESIPMRFSKWGQYIAALRVGNPPRTYNVLVDSGSSVTWIGARTPYGGAGVNTGQGVKKTYGISGGPFASFSGRIFRDTVTLGDGLTIPNYELAIASTSSNVRCDGVLGLGPRYLTANGLINRPGVTYPTFTDCLVSEDAIDENIIGIFFQPLTGYPDTDVGELAFGEPDYTKCIDNIVYTPITDALPSAEYWGIDQSITYGDTDILDETAGIIDTGTAFIEIAPYAYHRYQAATGATFDQPTGLLRITYERYTALEVLKFHISNQIFTLTANAQIWPRSLNTKLPGGGESSGIYLIITNLGTATRPGFGFIVGFTFMQRFYTVLDGDSFAVGFAITPFTKADTN
ncbi:family A1 protease [Suillus spraguei]|nr:family A1 protease [Suillus spraguei]